MNNAAGNNNDIKVFVAVKPIPFFLGVMSFNSTSLAKALKVCSGEMKEVFLLIESLDWKCPNVSVRLCLRTQGEFLLANS